MRWFYILENNHSLRPLRRMSRRQSGAKVRLDRPFLHQSGDMMVQWRCLNLRQGFNQKLLGQRREKKNCKVDKACDSCYKRLCFSIDIIHLKQSKSKSIAKFFLAGTSQHKNNIASQADLQVNDIDLADRLGSDTFRGDETVRFWRDYSVLIHK